jgi:outer membrane protein assembly factor BamC
MRVIKSGNLRWLVINEEPNLIWPHVSDFWEDLGFRVIIANKKTGIIETEWMDTDDIKLDKKSQGALSNFDKWLDSLSGFADKRKFRTRVEYGEGNSTEIYISQRSAQVAEEQHARILQERNSGYNPSTLYKIEEYKSDSDRTPEVKVDVSEQRKIADYEIDSELLTRLMIKLGATDLHAQTKVSNPEVIVKSELIKNSNSIFIKMNDPYDRAWRRLGLALDIIGFITEDKNRSKGIYLARFSQIEIPKEKKEEEEGIIDSLIFWDHDEKKDNDEDKVADETKAASKELVGEESNEPEFTGTDAPEVRPIDEGYISEELYDQKKSNKGEEETWLTSLWPNWGSEDESSTLPSNEKRYRIRIIPINESESKVFIDFPDGTISKSKDTENVLNIINEYLK